MDRIASLPNAFYDLIVFVGPTLILGVGIAIGTGGIGVIGDLQGFNIGALGTLLIVLAVVMASYEFGRLIETWSAIIVQRPLKWLAARTKLFNSPDFLRNLDFAGEYFGLDEAPDKRSGDKWIVYFYAFVAHPSIGSDLLKRYAWEKLSRSSACSFAILVAMSLGTLLARLVGVSGPPIGASYGFGSLEFTVVAALMAAATYVEYYKRNVWNFDLLTKVSPVLLHAMRLSEQETQRIEFLNLTPKSEPTVGTAMTEERVVPSSAPADRSS